MFKKSGNTSVSDWIAKLAGLLCLGVIVVILAGYLLGMVGDIYVVGLLLLCPLFHFFLLRTH